MSKSQPKSQTTTPDDHFDDAAGVPQQIVLLATTSATISKVPSLPKINQPTTTPNIIQDQSDQIRHLSNQVDQLTQIILHMQTKLSDFETRNFPVANQPVDQAGPSTSYADRQQVDQSRPEQAANIGPPGPDASLNLPDQRQPLADENDFRTPAHRSRLEEKNEIVDVIRQNIGGAWLYLGMKLKEAMEFFANLEREFARLPHLSSQIKVEIIRGSTHADAQHLIGCKLDYQQDKSEEEKDLLIINHFYTRSNIDLQAAFDDVRDTVITTSDLVAFCNDLETCVVTQSNLISARIRDQNAIPTNELRPLHERANQVTTNDHQQALSTPFSRYRGKYNTSLPSWRQQALLHQPQEQSASTTDFLLQQMTKVLDLLQKNTQPAPVLVQQPQPQPLQQQPSFYCGFHCMFGHSTERCVKLREYVAQNPNIDVSIYYRNTPENSYQPRPQFQQQNPQQFQSPGSTRGGYLTLNKSPGGPPAWRSESHYSNPAPGRNFNGTGEQYQGKSNQFPTRFYNPNYNVPSAPPLQSSFRTDQRHDAGLTVSLNEKRGAEISSNTPGTGKHGGMDGNNGNQTMSFIKTTVHHHYRKLEILKISPVIE